MNFLNVYLGKWFGVPVFLHWSWTLLFLFVLFAGGISSAFIYVGAFLLVLLHECGHCLMAQKYGIQPVNIVLFPIGGAAQINVPPMPKQEFMISIAGPMVNVFLIPLLYALTRYEIHPAFNSLFSINLMLFLFNFIPAFPMDGGRVLRSLLSMKWGHLKATKVAGRTGQVFCVGFVIWGCINLNPFLIMIGFFIFLAADQEIHLVKSHYRVAELYRLVFNRDPDFISPYDVKGSNRMLLEIERKITQLEGKTTQTVSRQEDAEN